MQKKRTPEKPLVLCVSGHDPSGGAGIHADIEACAANGAHALTVISANTVQDTRDVRRVNPVAPMLLAQQMQVLLEDCQIACIKIGLLGDAQQIPYLVNLIEEAAVPVVLDPVLRAGGGTALVAAQLEAALVEQLLPRVTVLTPNAAEARRLARSPSLDEAAAALLASGCGNVLITGGDEPGEGVRNSWHRPGAAPQHYDWPRLPAAFHGAGCTLAAALAARLAGGAALADALEQAQRYTHGALARAYATGAGRRIPGRWA